MPTGAGKVKGPTSAGRKAPSDKERVEHTSAPEELKDKSEAGVVSKLKEVRSAFCFFLLFFKLYWRIASNKQYPQMREKWVDQKS